MSNLKILFKYSWLRFIGTLQGKKQRKSSITSSLMVVLFAIGLLALYSLQAYSMFVGFAPLGLSKMGVFHACLISITVLLILGVMRSVGKNKHSDNDLLLSLPLKKWQIVISKIIGYYLLDIFFAFVLLMPFIVFYFVYSGFVLSTLIMSIITIFILPMFSVGLTCICKFIVGNVFNKSKYSSFYKSLFSVFILLVVFVLIFVKSWGYGSVPVESLDAYFADSFFSNCLLKLLLYVDIPSILIIFGICITTLVLGITLETISFGKAHVGYRCKDTNLKFKKSSTMFGILLKKEISNYLTTPAYISNTILAPIIIVVFSIIICSMGMDDFGQKLGIVLPRELFFGLITIIFLFALSTAIISCSTISLEGRNLWILKSHPISYNKLFCSKILLQIIFTLPAIVFASLLLLICLKLSILEFLLILIIPTIFTLMLSIAGVLVNLLFPKFDFSDEAQVVKQSKSALIMTFGGMILALLPLLAYSYLSLSIMNIAMLFSGIYLLLTVVFGVLLFTKGKKLFEKL